MRYISVCSGIEAATVAWHPLGWEPVLFSEIDKFPSAVLAHHYPQIPNIGDFTSQHAIEQIQSTQFDLLVGGTPCQDFSVAGQRAGFDGHRGNLTLEFINLLRRSRPRWFVWENVPGVLSIGKGQVFGTVLGQMAELGYGVAYRVLDAQYFGVPQRRRRVFVVGYLGDWRCAAAVLFERESLSRDSAPSRKTRKDVAPTISARTKGGGGLGTDFDCDGGLVEVAMCLNAKGGLGRIDGESETFVTHALRADGFDVSEDETDRGTPLVALNLRGRDGGSQAEPTELASLRASSGGSSRTYVGVRRLTPRECERLQGFPDDYTLVPHRNKPAADGPRYKALGNSMAVPCMRWIGNRIAIVDNYLRSLV